MKNYQTPEAGKIVGIIIGIDLHKVANYSNARRDSRIISVEDAEYNVQQVWFNETMISEFDIEPLLFIGNAVNIKVEHRIAGVTGFVNLDGVEEVHKPSVQTGSPQDKYFVPTDCDALSERAMRNLLGMTDHEITGILATRTEREKMTENRRADMFRDKQGNRQAGNVDEQIEIYRNKLASNPSELVRKQIQSKLDMLIAQKSGVKKDINASIKALEAELDKEVLTTRRATLENQIADLKLALKGEPQTQGAGNAEPPATPPIGE